MAAKTGSPRKLSEEQRAEKRAAERELMEHAVEELRSSAGWKRWLDVRRHFRTYSLHNQFLIADQRLGATYVAGFRRWLSLGYAVRKGEHGIRIWAPCPPSAKQLRAWREEGENPDTKPPTHFRLVSVFDRSQVDPLPEFPGQRLDLEPPVEPIEGNSLSHLFDPLAAFGASLGYTVAVEVISGSALGYCSPDRHRIGVEVVSGDFSPNAQVATEVHELAHALVRCDRREEDPELIYREEEVVVECVAFSVCSTFGLDTSGYSVPYLTSWSKGGEIERYARLIDRLASRLEDAALTVEAAEPEQVPLAA